MREFFFRWIQGTLRGIGQVMLQENAMTGLCFLLGIAIDSFWMALGTVLGVVVSMATAAILGWNSKGIHAGIYGFNGALVGVAGFFGAEHAARIVLALANETMTLLPPNSSLHSFAESLVGAIRRFQVFADDLTLFAAFGYLGVGPAWISYFDSKPDSSQPDTA